MSHSLYCRLILNWTNGGWELCERCTRELYKSTFNLIKQWGRWKPASGQLPAGNTRWLWSYWSALRGWHYTMAVFNLIYCTEYYTESNNFHGKLVIVSQFIAFPRFKTSIFYRRAINFTPNLLFVICKFLCKWSGCSGHVFCQHKLHKGVISRLYKI